MESVMFVYGGTPASEKSNRMKEKGANLFKISETLEDTILLSFTSLKRGNFRDKDGSVIESLAGAFDLLTEQGINIIGSKDVVYRSDQMAMLIRMVGKGDVPVGAEYFFPKTHGLRDLIHKLNIKIHNNKEA